MNHFRGAGAMALVVLVALGPVAASAQSLTDTLIRAYQHAPELKSGRAALRGTDEGVAQAWAALRPSLDGSVSYGDIYSSTSLATSNYVSASIALSLSLTLWDGGAGGLAVDVARANVQAARYALVDTEQKVLLNAAISFLDMRRDAKFLELAENNHAVIGKQVQAAKDRFEVGEIRRTDVSQAEARLAGALSVIGLRQGNLEISRQSFYIATGAYPGNLHRPPPVPRTPTTLAAAKSIALRTHPLMLRAREFAKVAELNVYRAEASMKPKLSLSGSISSNVNRGVGNHTSLSLGGSVPLYHGGALTSALRQAKALQEQSRFDIELTAQSISQNVTRFWSQLKIARAAITARQKEVRSARVALQGIREEANLGARTTLDVLDAERVLVEAQTNLVASQRDENVAVYSLLSAMGLLTVKHLGLGIKSYDPKINYDKVSKAPGPTNRGKLLEKIFKRAGKK